MPSADRQQPSAELLNHKWENAMTVQRTTWGYSKFEDLSGYLRSGDIIKELLSTVAFGGNVLLNVGPTADGLILPIFEQILGEVGDYLDLNGEAIYSTRAHPAVQNASANGTLAYFTAGAGQDYYLTVGMPDLTRPVVVPLRGARSAEVLARGGNVPIECAPQGVTLVCSLPVTLALGNRLDKNGLVIKLARPEGQVIV